MNDVHVPDTEARCEVHEVRYLPHVGQLRDEVEVDFGPSSAAVTLHLLQHPDVLDHPLKITLQHNCLGGGLRSAVQGNRHHVEPGIHQPLCKSDAKGHGVCCYRC